LVPHIFLGIYWLAMSNSMVNPIIYYWMNKRFRHYFQRVMCFCCLQLWYNNNNMNQLDNTYMQPNSYSIERKSKSCKYFILAGILDYTVFELYIIFLACFSWCPRKISCLRCMMCVVVWVSILSEFLY
jgi:hypothetical protein